jgi:glycosyltransferase involved in cell wall biosynthesis
MKVLLVTGIFPPDIGGPATFVPKFADYLLKKGHEVRILTLAEDIKPQSSDITVVTRINRNLRKPLRTFSIIWEILRVPSDFKIFANGLHEEVGLSQVVKSRRSIAKIVGDPVWERARNNNVTTKNIVEFNRSDLKLKNRLQRILLVFALNRFNAITCPSTELCEFVKQWGVDQPTKFIANGTEIQPLNNNSDREYDLISVSRLVSWKNIDRHIEIAIALNLKMAIVGSGPEEFRLRELAKEHNSEITFLGELTSLEINRYMQKSRVFILLSEYEGLSYSLLEALAFGLPAIVSDIEANTEVVRNKIEGIVLPKDDWQKSLQQIRDIFESDAIYKQYSHNARSRIAEAYEIDFQLAKIEELLK